MALLASGFAVLADDLLHVLAPQVAVLLADVMRSHLVLRVLIVGASVAVESSRRLLLGLSNLWNWLLLLHLLLHLNRLLWLRRLTLSQILLLALISRRAGSRVVLSLSSYLLLGIHQLKNLLARRASSRDRLQVLNAVGDLSNLLFRLGLNLSHGLVLALLLTSLLSRMPALVRVLPRVLIVATIASSTNASSSSPSSARWSIEIPHRRLLLDHSSSHLRHLEWRSAHERLHTSRTPLELLLLLLLHHLWRWWSSHMHILRWIRLLLLHGHLVHHGGTWRWWWSLRMSHDIRIHLKHRHLRHHLRLLSLLHLLLSWMLRWWWLLELSIASHGALVWISSELLLVSLWSLLLLLLSLRRCFMMTLTSLGLLRLTIPLALPILRTAFRRGRRRLLSNHNRSWHGYIHRRVQTIHHGRLNRRILRLLLLLMWWRSRWWWHHLHHLRSSTILPLTSSWAHETRLWSLMSWWSLMNHRPGEVLSLVLWVRLWRSRTELVDLKGSLVHLVLLWLLLLLMRWWWHLLTWRWSLWVILRTPIKTIVRSVDHKIVALIVDRIAARSSVHTLLVRLVPPCLVDLSTSSLVMVLVLMVLLLLLLTTIIPSGSAYLSVLLLLLLLLVTFLLTWRRLRITSRSLLLGDVIEDRSAGLWSMTMLHWIVRLLLVVLLLMMGRWWWRTSAVLVKAGRSATRDGVRLLRRG